MRKGLAALLVAGSLVATAAPAYAWELVDEDRGFRRAFAAGWTRNYDVVRFYAGHDAGESGTFFVEYGVTCRGGFEFYEEKRAHDTRSRFWSDTVRIPNNEGRCDEAIRVRAVNPRRVYVTGGIEAR